MTPTRRLRLHEHAYPLEYINDGDYDTRWISKTFYMPGGVTIDFFMENGEYEVSGNGFHIVNVVIGPCSRLLSYWLAVTE